MTNQFIIIFENKNSSLCVEISSEFNFQKMFKSKQKNIYICVKSSKTINCKTLLNVFGKKEEKIFMYVNVRNNEEHGKMPNHIV